MARLKKDAGMFAEIKVSGPNQIQNSPCSENDVNASSWRFIKITYPNGVTITVPSEMEPATLSRYMK